MTMVAIIQNHARHVQVHPEHPGRGGADRAARGDACRVDAHRDSSVLARARRLGRSVRWTKRSWRADGAELETGLRGAAASSARVPMSVAWAVRPSCWRATTSRSATNAPTASAGPVTVTPPPRSVSASAAVSTRAAVEHDDVLEQPLDLADQVAGQDDRAGVLQPVGEQHVVERVPRGGVHAEVHLVEQGQRRAAGEPDDDARTPTACPATAGRLACAGRARSGPSARPPAHGTNSRPAVAEELEGRPRASGRAGRRRSPGPGTCRPAPAAFSHGSSPSTSTVPDVVRRNAASTDSSVVLPEPLRPSSPVITPGRMLNETASSATVVP